MQAALNYRRYVAHSLAKTTDELEAMAKAAAEEGANVEGVYRNQIRLRKYVYQIKKLPNIGETDKERLKQSVVGVLVAEQTKPLPKLHAQPAAMRLRDRLVAPDRHAMQLDIEHLAAMVAAQKAMMALVSEGKFVANPRGKPTTTREPPAKQPKTGGQGRGGGRDRGRGRGRGRGRAGARSDQDESEEQRAIAGEQFTDEGEEWIVPVLDVGWEAKAKGVLVWYYRAARRLRQER